MAELSEAPRIVRVRWRDTCTRNGWETTADLRRLAKEGMSIVNESVGWLIASSSNEVIVAANRTISPDTRPYAEVTAIPACCVVALDFLAEARADEVA